ncbi:HicB family protein [Candidatus Magnetoovum chiemensis]|nr:HicB family protein [Candidatus Magnetoovum chiemensis]
MVFYGKIFGIRDLIMYESDTLEGLMNDFKAAVDEYIEACDKEGRDVKSLCNLNI